MIDSATVQWTLTVVFAVTACYYLYGLLARPDQWRHGLRPATDDILHIVMSVAMIAMLWSWGSVVPVMAYVLVFTAAALWFVARALFFPSPDSAGVGDPPVTAGHHGSRGFAWYHAAMMGSMVWMAVVMSVGMSTLPTSSSAASASMAAMPGMSMPGMDMGPSSSTTATAMAVPVQWWVRGPSVLVAIAFVAAAVWLVWAGVRGRVRYSLAAGGISGLMALGMAAVFVELV